MDLVARGPNGRLDSLAACKLLWSGALSLGASSLAWDGQTHRVLAPVINDSVLSLYKLSREDVETLIPDLSDLLVALGRDVELTVPDEQLANSAREAVPTGRLSGVSLFALQSDAHPLIVELVDMSTLRVRYDEQLARGIFHLQELLRRMCCHLWLFRGSEGPVTVLFCMNAARDGTSGTQVLDPRVEIDKDEVAAVEPFHRQSPATMDDTTVREDRAISLLQASIYTTRVLLSSTSNRLKTLEERRQSIEDAKPKPPIDTYRGRSPLGPTASAKAARSLVVRSAVYLGMGITLMWLGRMCMAKQDELFRLIESLWNQIVSTVTDGINITLGLTDEIGVHDTIELPADTIKSVLGTAGFIFMGLGILLPVLKILRHKRKLDRKLRQTKGRQSLVAELTALQTRSAEVVYAQSLEAWASSLTTVAHEVELTKKSVRMLQTAEQQVEEALGRVGLVGSGTAPTATPAIQRSACLLARSINAMASEEERHERIAAYCEEIANVVLKIQ